MSTLTSEQLAAAATSRRIEAHQAIARPAHTEIEHVDQFPKPETPAEAARYLLPIVDQIRNRP